MPNILQKFANWNKSWNNHIIIDQDMIIYNYIGVWKILFNQDSIVNFHTGYFSSKISSQKKSSCKKINMYPFVHTKKIVQYAFYCNFVPFGCSESIGWQSIIGKILPNLWQKMFRKTSIVCDLIVTFEFFRNSSWLVKCLDPKRLPILILI